MCEDKGSLTTGATAMIAPRVEVYFMLLYLFKKIDNRDAQRDAIYTRFIYNGIRDIDLYYVILLERSRYY